MAIESHSCGGYRTSGLGRCPVSAFAPRLQFECLHTNFGGTKQNNMCMETGGCTTSAETSSHFSQLALLTVYSLGTNPHPDHLNVWSSVLLLDISHHDIKRGPEMSKCRFCKIVFNVSGVPEKVRCVYTRGHTGGHEFRSDISWWRIVQRVRNAFSRVAAQNTKLLRRTPNS